MNYNITVRRLFVFHFTCPLCGLVHINDLYLTIRASNQDEMIENALQTLERDQLKIKILTPFPREYHPAEGEYLELTKAYTTQGKRHPFTTTSVTMTDDESYTCEFCGVQFDTVTAW